MPQTWILQKGSDRAVKIKRIAEVLGGLAQNVAWELRLVRFKRQRSDPQNNYLWGVAYKMLSEETGMPDHALHDGFCRKFFGEVVLEFGDYTIVRPRRTTTVDAENQRDVIPWDTFSEFMEMVIEAGHFVGIDIPPPDPEWWKKENGPA